MYSFLSSAPETCSSSVTSRADVYHREPTNTDDPSSAAQEMKDMTPLAQRQQKHPEEKKQKQASPIVSLSFLNTREETGFEPKLDNIVHDYFCSPEEVESYLTAVAEAAPEEKDNPDFIKTVAERLATENPYLTTRAGRVSDAGGRTFSCITAFQYCIIGGGFKMLKWMEPLMHKANTAKQLQELIDTGVIAEKKDGTKEVFKVKRDENTGELSCDAFAKPYLDAWKEVDSLLKNGEYDLADRKAVEGIGGAQSAFFAFTKNHFSHPTRSFDKGVRTDFNAQLPRTQSPLFTDPRLSVTLYIWRGPHPTALSVRVPMSWNSLDLYAVQSLLAHSNKQLNTLARRSNISDAPKDSSSTCRI